MSHIFVQFLLYEVVVNIFANAGLKAVVGDYIFDLFTTHPIFEYLSSTTSEVACQSGSTRFHPSHRGCRCVGGSDNVGQALGSHGKRWDG